MLAITTKSARIFVIVTCYCFGLSFLFHCENELTPSSLLFVPRQQKRLAVRPVWAVILVWQLVMSIMVTDWLSIIITGVVTDTSGPPSSPAIGMSVCCKKNYLHLNLLSSRHLKFLVYDKITVKNVLIVYVFLMI